MRIAESRPAGMANSLKKAAVTAALEEYVKARRRLKILDWMGKVEYYDDYDHKSLRRAGLT